MLPSVGIDKQTGRDMFRFCGQLPLDAYWMKGSRRDHRALPQIPANYESLCFCLTEQKSHKEEELALVAGRSLNELAGHSQKAESEGPMVPLDSFLHICSLGKGGSHGRVPPTNE